MVVIVYVPVDLSGSDAYFDACACECSPGDREGTVAEESVKWPFEDHSLRV